MWAALKSFFFPRSTTLHLLGCLTKRNGQHELKGEGNEGYSHYLKHEITQVILEVPRVVDRFTQVQLNIFSSSWSDSSACKSAVGINYSKRSHCGKNIWFSASNIIQYLFHPPWEAMIPISYLACQRPVTVKILRQYVRHLIRSNKWQ